MRYLRVGVAVALVGLAAGSPALAAKRAAGAEVPSNTVPEFPSLRPRLEKALDRWCRWLSGYLYQIPGTDLYTLNPTLGTGANPYRDVAGNQFAAAAAGYWLHRSKPDEATAEPLRGLIRLALGTHIANNTIDRPDIQKWGATLTHADDWHADLFAVAQGMLLLDALPPERREQMRRILEWEADKQVEYGVSKEWRTWPGRSPGHSCGESNSWSATLLQMARLAMPGSERHAAWRESAIEYSLNAICTPADMTSDEIVGGKPLKERVKGANFEPGGIQEHHYFYHPGYMGWPLAYQAYAHLMDQALPADQRNADVYLHNWRLAYDRLKQGTFSNGRFIHCAGDDWITYGYGNTQFMPAALFAAAEFRDPDASRIVDEWLKMIEMQQDLTGGSVQGARLATMLRLRLNDFSWYEGQEGCCLAQALWVLDRIDPAAIPAPASEAEYDKRNTSTYHEPNANLIWHRDEHRWASFSWRAYRKQAQAIVQPIGLPHLLRFNANSTGILQISGLSPSYEIEWFELAPFAEGGFWSLGSIGRESKRVIHEKATRTIAPLVRQYQALVALPEGPTVFIDQCRALDQLWLLRTGALGMRLAADVFNGNAVRLAWDGQERTFGQADCRDVWHDLGTRSITVEKLLTIHALTGDGTFQFLQKRKRSPDRSEMIAGDDAFGPEESLLSHELYFGPPAYDRPRILNPQDWVQQIVLVAYCDPANTPARPTGTVSGAFPCLAVHLPDAGCTIAVNFAEDDQSVDSPAGRITVGPRSVRIVR
ncbi:MAG: hypothetical protein GXY55_08980 [Phycisphaerae bacterium]|nr:hypothetical protein [Phycisphaerae bacterium]